MGGDDGRYGWCYQGTEPSAVIAISLRGLSSIKHAQESLMTSGADHFAVRQSKTILTRSACASEAEQSGLQTHIATTESVCAIESTISPQN